MTAEPVGYGVTAEEIRAYPWPKILMAQKQRDCFQYSIALNSAASACDASDQVGKRVLGLFAMVCSPHPWMEGPEKSFLRLKDRLSSGDLLALKEVLNEIGDPELRARIGDILWELKRDYAAAQVAARTYLEAAEFFKPDDLWPPYAERMERAVILAAKLGFGKPLHQEILAAIDAAAMEAAGREKADLLCHRLQRVAHDQESTRGQQYASLSEKLALGYASDRQWRTAEKYWLTAARWHTSNKLPDDAARCRLAAAESIISGAEAMLKSDRPSAGMAGHWMGKGVEALRQARASPERIEAVHRRFLELQAASMSEMGRGPEFGEIPGFEDAIAKSREAAAAHVCCDNLEDAVARFANITKPVDPVPLRARILEDSKTNIWQHVVSTTAVDHHGKVTDTLSSDPEESIRQQMCLQAREVDWPLKVDCHLEPARRAIVAQHVFRALDLEFLCRANPLVPPGHEVTILRGLHAGFQGDWLVAMHLLIPQLEAIIRHALQCNGVVTSTLQSDNTQEERDVNQLLCMKEAVEVFGEDFTFNLRGILIERFGHNMRNTSAHGLMPTGEFYQAASIYFWWLMLVICWRGFVFDQRNLPSSSTERSEE